MTANGFHYDGRTFASAGAPETTGADGSVPRGHYHQTGDLVWGEISGGAVRVGSLAGTCGPDGTIRFAYCQVLVDGTPAGSTRAIEEAGRLQRIDELFNILKSKRELWKATQGGTGKAFAGICVLQVDQMIPALVVKSVFQTAAFAGYPNVSFMVGQLPKNEHH